MALSNSQLILGGYFYSFTCASCAAHLLVVDLFGEELFFIDLFSLFTQ